MAHVQKLTAGAMGGLSTHCERKTDNHKNKKIDPKKTHENYALDNNENPLQYFKQRMGEVRINQKRDDIKVAASWVVTQPRDIKPEESRKFFEATHNFLAKKYGKKNTIWSRVHMDESTPHLHFCFMPITPDKKHDGQEKICAKDVLTRAALKSFHSELSEEIKRIFGRDIGIETGNTEKNLELEQLKLKTKTDEAAKELAKTEELLKKITIKKDDLIDGRKLAKKLSEEHKASIFKSDTMTIKRDLLQSAIDYAWNGGGKDEEIKTLKCQVSQLEKSLDEYKK